MPVSRRNFVELCERLTLADEKQFEDLWRTLGLSVDWSSTYQTIGESARKVAQAAFLRNLARGEAYQAQAPGLWDVTFQTAVAQAELESREYPGFYHRLASTLPTPRWLLRLRRRAPQLKMGLMFILRPLALSCCRLVWLWWLTPTRALPAPVWHHGF